MNRDSINEYISWLEEFGEIYEKYINSSEELEEIYGNALINFYKILSVNNVNSTEKDIIASLKELVYKFSKIYDGNKSINKTLKGPRNTNKFKQDIYNTEIAKLKEWLMDNINNKELFLNFESIVMFVAKKRQMIEFLKLRKVFNDYSSNHLPEIEKYIYFEPFGKIRKVGLHSFFKRSHAEHLIDYGYRGDERKIKYKYKDNTFDLTLERQLLWDHTKHSLFPQLFAIMNELYIEFLSLVNRRNNASKRDILVELYWLYMQTCPFERGSASIGEILFSVLLRKYFGCDFLISNGWDGNPLTIPDIHALHYQLDEFKEIFWEQLTDCGLKNNSNNNN
jgi:hypothetical protein